MNASPQNAIMVSITVQLCKVCFSFMPKYYTFHSTDQQTIDIYIEDNFGQVVQKTFSWQSEQQQYPPDN